MKRVLLTVVLIAAGATTASAQFYDRSFQGGGCSREKRDAERHYYTALRNQGGKGFLDAGEQRVQQQLQARYDACIANFGHGRYSEAPRRRYEESPRGYGRSCDRERREAERHYYTAMRNQGGKGYLDAGEQRVQQQLQARYDACRGGY